MLHAIATLTALWAIWTMLVLAWLAHHLVLEMGALARALWRLARRSH